MSLRSKENDDLQQYSLNRIIRKKVILLKNKILVMM
jgi:hypothetical protein